MKTQLSPHDLELLSAYVDQQLSQAERTRLENRLKTDLELEKALRSLQITRLLLRNSPRLRAPRNFTLTPQMAKVRPIRPIYPFFSLASAVAGLLLVIVLVSDLAGLGQRLTSRALESEAPAAVALQAPQQEDEAAPTVLVEEVTAKEAAPAPTATLPVLTAEVAADVEAESETVLREAPPGAGVGGGEATIESGPALSQALVPPAGTPGEMGLMEAAPAVSDTSQVSVTQEAFFTAEPSPTSLPAATETPAEAVAKVLPITPEASPTVVVPAATPLPAEAPRESKLTFRIAEIALAILAISAGLAALYLRRKTFG